MESDKEDAQQTGIKTTFSKKTTSEPGIAHALVVDDEAANQDFLVRLLQQAKLIVYGASNGKTALKIVEEHGSKIKLVMLDHKLPDQTGMELLVKLRKTLPDAKIIMATMYDEPSMMREAFESDCTAFLVKPHGFMELFKRVQGIHSDPDCLDQLDKLIFDQYGPRPWRS